jgi:diacylglycerol kinase family enzyme
MRETAGNEAIVKPQRVGVLINASSGTIQGQGRDRIREALDAAFARHAISPSLEFISGENLQSSAEQALQNVGRGELDAIVIAGGDGSIRTTASVLAGGDIVLGIVPLGTLNHFAKDLDIPLSLDAAVAVIAAGNVRLVDVAEVNGRVFINNSSVGIYPSLILDRERQRRRQGLSKWSATALAALRAIRYFPIRRLSIAAEQDMEPARSPCVFIGNNEYRLTGPTLGSRARLDGGKLCLYIARQQSAAALLWLACRCVLGLLDPKRDLRIAMPRAVTISSHRHRLLVASDGEVEIIRSPLQYRIRPGALRVFAPPAEAAQQN